MNDVIAPVVRRERDGRVARVVIGPGVRRNALTSAAWAGIDRTIRRIAEDETVRVVVIEGAAGWFCAGSDIREWMDASPDQVELSFARMEAACTAVEELPIPVIAKVRGPAAGAGCQLALACDLTFLAKSASIGMPIARLGILVSSAFTNRLAARCGGAVAAELLYTGRMVPAVEAVHHGLANACITNEGLDAHVDGVVDSILDVSAASVRAAKRAIAHVAMPARQVARSVSGRAVDEADFASGVAAFIEGTMPRGARMAR